MRRAFRGLAWLLLAGCVLLAAGGLLLRSALAPLPGEWAAPLRLGPLRLTAGVPSLVRLATAPWLAPVLDGRSLVTAAGRVHITRLADGKTLSLRCAPCALRVPGMGDERLLLPDLRMTVRREGDQLEGMLTSGKVRATWQGQLDKARIQLALQLPPTPVAEAYALLGDALPEAARARIQGDVAMDARLSLPDGRFSATPRLDNFQVAGLGTEALAHARSHCASAASQLTADSWLARAVIAAEDQRFYTHAGYDMAELGAALDRNQDQGRIRRGGSTLSQQLARLLVTGGERSPARKLRELLYAVEMEQTLGKARILQLYLANAPWGDGLCGAESAARFYFQRPAHTLAPAQAAWLAAMLHNPGLEAGRWARTGQINRERTLWVMQGMRPLPPQSRRPGAAALAAMAYPVPAEASAKPMKPMKPMKPAKPVSAAMAVSPAQAESP